MVEIKRDALEGAEPPKRGDVPVSPEVALQRSSFRSVLVEGEWVKPGTPEEDARAGLRLGRALPIGARGVRGHAS